MVDDDCSTQPVMMGGIPSDAEERVMTMLERLGFSTVPSDGDMVDPSEVEILAITAYGDNTPEWDVLGYSEKEKWRNAVGRILEQVHVRRVRDTEDGLHPNLRSDAKWFREADAPLVVSITGHYNIDPDYHGFLESEIRGLFTDLRTRCPHTRIVLMTGMDEGTDMMVSRMALEEGAFLAPVFPMGFDDYMSMRPGRDVRELDSILSHPRCFDPYIMECGTTGTEAFRLMAVHLVSRAHLVVSVWNGEGTDHNGGAFDTTDMAINGMDPGIKGRYARMMTGIDDFTTTRYLDIPDDCPVFWIRCPRGEGNGTAKTGLSGYIIPASMSDYEDRSTVTETVPYPDGGQVNLHDVLPEPYGTLFDNIDRFNSEFCTKVEYVMSQGVVTDVIHGMTETMRSEMESSASRCYHYLLEYKSDAYAEGVMYPPAEPLTEHGSHCAIASRYFVTDHLSMQCQTRTRKDLWNMAFLTVLSSALFSLLMLSNAPIVVNIAYTAVAAAVVVLTTLHNRNRSFHRYIDYRCLSECCRVEYYRALMGIQDPFCVASYGYMRNELMWVRAIIKAWGTEFSNRDTYIPATVDTGDVTFNCWIKGQEYYHARKKGINSRLLGSRESWAGVVARVSLVLSVALMAVDILQPDVAFGRWDGFWIGDTQMHHGFNLSLGNLLKLVMIGVASAGLYISYSRDRVFGGTPGEIGAKQRMFSTAAREFLRMTDERERADLVHELGNQTISEVNDWVFEHKTRDFRKKDDDVDTVSD